MTYILLTLKHKKPIPDMTDHVTNRLYTWLKNIDSSADVVATIVEEKKASELLKEKV